jgi:hypothetical protein
MKNLLPMSHKEIFITTSLRSFTCWNLIASVTVLGSDNALASTMKGSESTLMGIVGFILGLCAVLVVPSRGDGETSEFTRTHALFLFPSLGALVFAGAPELKYWLDNSESRSIRVEVQSSTIYKAACANDSQRLRDAVNERLSDKKYGHLYFYYAIRDCAVGNREKFVRIVSADTGQASDAAPAPTSVELEKAHFERKNKIRRDNEILVILLGAIYQKSDRGDEARDYEYCDALGVVQGRADAVEALEEAKLPSTCVDKKPAMKIP